RPIPAPIRAANATPATIAACRRLRAAGFHHGIRGLPADEHHRATKRNRIAMAPGADDDLHGAEERSLQELRQERPRASIVRTRGHSAGMDRAGG
ncbi:MAG: hypothetical protein WKF47_17510, partial [Geodermatophilaceae bacterium]